MRARIEQAGKGFARLATRVSVARPRLWRMFRAPIRLLFNRLATGWERRTGPEGLIPLGAALERLEAPPARVLDLGTGTGKAARVVARLFPDAEIDAVDLSPAMVEEARRLLPAELAGRVRFRVADAAELPYEDGAFDLVVLLNMIPFFGELARVSAPGAGLIVAFSQGAETPIYVPFSVLREKLGAAGFREFEEITAGDGSALTARRSPCSPA